MTSFVDRLCAHFQCDVKLLIQRYQGERQGIHALISQMAVECGLQVWCAAHGASGRIVDVEERPVRAGLVETMQKIFTHLGYTIRYPFLPYVYVHINQADGTKCYHLYPIEFLY